MDVAITLNGNERTEIFERFAAAAEEKNSSFTLDGPIMTTVQRKEGDYRNYSLEPQEFFFVGANYGAGNKEIMIFQPEDHDERYEKVEVKLKDIDKFFPTFTEALKSWAVTSYIDPSEDDAELSKAVVEALIKPETIATTLYQMEQKRKEDAEKAQLAQMRDDPMFGMF